MTYRELLRLYETGELDPETRERVERDIQRQDAIGEYLFEKAEIPPLDGGGEDLDLPVEENKEFLALVQKSIRRAFWKLGVTVCAVVLVVALLAVFALPKAVDLFYYDPTEVVGRDPEWPDIETDRMSLDTAVWTEAFVPGAYRDNVIARPRGYGVYDLTICQTVSASGGFTNLGGTLERNHLTLFDPNLLKRPVGNAFVLPGEEESGTFASREDAFAAVDRLDEATWYQGYVSLSEIMDYADFMSWYDGLKHTGRGLWCAVYGENGAHHLGFYPGHGGAILHWDQETYPLLGSVGEDLTPEDAVTHFTSMVRYLRDNPAFGEMMGCVMDDSWTEQLLERIQRDGLQIYGFSITAQKDTFQALREDPHVNYLYTVPTR